MKKHFFVLLIIVVSANSQAQSSFYDQLSIDSTELMSKLDSAIKANPDFGYTSIDTALIMLQILSPEDLLKVLEGASGMIEKYNANEEISEHLEGGWKVAATSANKEYYLMKPLRGDKFWVKQLSKSNKGAYYKASLTLYKIDCKEGMLGIVQTTEYEINGDVAYSSPTRDDIIVSMSYAAPDTIGEALVESACK